MQINSRSLDNFCLSFSHSLMGFAGLKKTTASATLQYVDPKMHSHTDTLIPPSYVCVCVSVGSGIAGGDCHSRRLLMAAIARRKFSNRISTENLQLSKIYSLLRGVVYVTMQWGLWSCTRCGTEIEMSSLASELYNRSTYLGNGNGQKSDVKISLISFFIFHYGISWTESKIVFSLEFWIK